MTEWQINLREIVQDRNRWGCAVLLDDLLESLWRTSGRSAAFRGGPVLARSQRGRLDDQSHKVDRIAAVGALPCPLGHKWIASGRNRAGGTLGLSQV